MNNSPSPEEKLLSLIKKSAKKQDPPTINPSMNPIDHLSSENKSESTNIQIPLKNEDLTHEPNFIISNTLKVSQWIYVTHKLKLTQNLVYILSSLCIFFLIAQTFFIKNSLTFYPKESLPKNLTQNLSNSSTINSEEFKKLLTISNQRKYFKSIPKPKPKAQKNEKIPTISEQATGLNIVGILDGDPPQAIIENTKDRQIYYLSENQKINDITIKTVKRNSVILTFNDEELELSI